MRRGDLLRLGQVGDRAGQLEDTVEGARGELRAMALGAQVHARASFSYSDPSLGIRRRQTVDNMGCETDRGWQSFLR